MPSPDHPLMRPRESLVHLQTDTPSMRTEHEVHELLNLPRTLVVLEQKIQKVAGQLGSQEFRELTGTAGKEQTTFSFNFFQLQPRNMC